MTFAPCLLCYLILSGPRAGGETPGRQGGLPGQADLCTLIIVQIAQ